MGAFHGKEVVMTSEFCPLVMATSTCIEKGLSTTRTEREVGGMDDTLAEASASQSQVGKEVWVLTGLCKSEQVVHSQTFRAVAFL